MLTSKSQLVLELLCSSTIGYSYWSLFLGLGPMIWFYPLNELDITGYEAFVVVVLSPILVGNSTESSLGSNVFSKILLLLMIVGCASFNASTTLARLASVSFGVGAASLVQCISWWNKNVVEQKIQFWGYVVGFFALLTSRIWYLSITPMWSDAKTNQVLVSLLAIAICAKIIFSTTEPVKSSKNRQNNPRENMSGPVLIPSLGYGAVTFMLHSVFGEVSLVSRYTIKGFPDHGLTPNPWGGLILVMMGVGLLTAMHAGTYFLQHWAWSLAGFASSMGLMFLSGVYGFACGALLSVYVVSVFPLLSEYMVSSNRPGLSLVIANLVYLAGVFGMVWCTAYNFVPFGGELAREKTYIIIGVMMLMIGIATWKKSNNGAKISLNLRMPLKKYYVKESKAEITPQQIDDENLGITVKKIIFGLMMIGLLGFEYRNKLMPTYNQKINDNFKSVSGKDEFSALIWTFHFGYDNQGWPSFERAAKLLNDTGADFITLLESDASKPYLGNNDIAMWLGEKLGMYSDFGPSTKDHTWGNLILSKYPIIKSKHHLLPSPHGELAPAISATINITGKLVDFVVTHMGNDRDNLDRKLQAKKLSELCNEATNPVVFLGYVTSAPGSRDYKQLTEQGRMKDIDSTDKDRWCEYILYRGLIRLGYTRISHGGLSDTELQMGKWKIPASKDYKDHNNMIKTSKNIPVHRRFNKIFGNNHRGHWHAWTHHYHMDTPKYFVP